MSMKPPTKIALLYISLILGQGFRPLYYFNKDMNCQEATFSKIVFVMLICKKKFLSIHMKQCNADAKLRYISETVAWSWRVLKVKKKCLKLKTTYLHYCKFKCSLIMESNLMDLKRFLTLRHLKKCIFSQFYKYLEICQIRELFELKRNCQK